MNIKKSFVIYLIITAIMLTLGAISYTQIVREQTPITVDDEPTTQPNSDSQSSLKIDKPLTITGQQIIK